MLHSTWQVDSEVDTPNCRLVQREELVDKMHKPAREQGRYAGALGNLKVEHIALPNVGLVHRAANSLYINQSKL